MAAPTLLCFAPGHLSGPACGTGQGRPLKEADTWGAPPSWDLALTLLGLAPSLRHFSPQSPSSLRFLAPLKFHAQCHPSISLRDQQPLLLFPISRTLPSLRLLSSVTLMPHRAHSLTLKDQKTLVGPRTSAMHTRLRYLSSGDKRSIAIISALSF